MKDYESLEVQYLLKNVKLEELLPKARDAVNLFFLNIKANPQGVIVEESNLCIYCYLFYRDRDIKWYISTEAYMESNSKYFPSTDNK